MGEKYHRHSQILKDGIEKFFDGQIPVDVIDVPIPYAMEVRIVPDYLKGHPSRQAGKEMEFLGARTMFSKIESKKWPKLDVLIPMLTEFCQVPIQIQLRSLGRMTGGVSIASAVNVAGSQDSLASTSKTALPLETLHCTHVSTQRKPTRPLITDTNGQTQTTFILGDFSSHVNWIVNTTA